MSKAELEATKKTGLSFKEAISYEWRDNSCIVEDDIVSFNKMRCQNKSEFLVHKISLWQEREGWQNFQEDKGGKERFKHFTIYFDDVGSLNVIASKYEVES